ITRYGRSTNRADLRLRPLGHHGAAAGDSAGSACGAQGCVSARTARTRRVGFSRIAGFGGGAPGASFEPGGIGTMRMLFGICWLIALTVVPTDGGEPLTLTVTPAQSFAPARVRIRARIEPSAVNRVLTVVADGSEFYRSSEFQLDGEAAPKTFDLFFADLPGGEYDVYAYLTDSLGRRRAVVHQPATVLAMLGGVH